MTIKTFIDDVFPLFLMAIFVFFCLSFELESFLRGIEEQEQEQAQPIKIERGYQTWD